MNADEAILALHRVDLKNKQLLPEYSGIYYVVSEDNIVWYIGQAKNIRKRWSGKAHHRFYQLSSQKKKQFYIYYESVHKSYLDKKEKELIAKYRPHLNSSPVKKRKVIPSENLLRETILKLSDLLTVLGIEPLRLIKTNTIKNDWLLHKKIEGLHIIHIVLDYDKLLEFCDQDIEISSGILGHVFDTRKAYASLWELPYKTAIKKMA